MTEAEMKQALVRALSTVREPSTGRDLLTAGLVQELELDLPRVVVKIELEGAPAARLAAVEASVKQALLAVDGVGEVSVAFVAPESTPGEAGGDRGPRRLPMAGGQKPPTAAAPAAHGHGQAVANRQRIPGVRHLVAVASGKGGVGKSTVCVNLALALRHLGAKVGLLDADIYGPSIPTMLGVNRRPHANENKKLVPLTSYGLELMSLGFLVDEGTPVIWRGPMVQGVVRQFLHDVEWGDLDYLMIDMPPGTGDAQLTLVQSVALSGVVIVTTPSDIALIDAAKGLQMFRTVDVPVFGIVENMSYFLCPHCDERTDIFSAAGGKRVADKLDTPFLGEIPLEIAIRKGGDEGKPIVAADPESRAAAPFLALARTLRERCEGATGEQAKDDKKGFFASLLNRH